MDSQTLILLQLELECIRLNHNAYLESFQCDNPDEAARLYIYRDAEQYYRFLRYDLDPTLRQHIKLLREERLFEEHEMIQRILSEERPCETFFHGRSYIFCPTVRCAGTWKPATGSTSSWWSSPTSRPT